MSSGNKAHPYYARTYTQHVIRASGNVEVYPGRPFTKLHAVEAGSTLHQPMPGIHDGGLALFAATNLVESWNNRHNNLRNHFPRFFYTVE